MNSLATQTGMDFSVGVLVLLLMLATWHDVRSNRIPNWLVLSGMLLGLLLNTALPVMASVPADLPGGLGLGKSIAGLGVGLLALLPMYLLRAMGAGDVKLMAMVGAFLGPVNIFVAVLYTLVAGGILAILAALYKGVFRSMLRNIQIMIYARAAKIHSGFKEMPVSAVKLPYAVAISTGTGAYLVSMLIAH